MTEKKLDFEKALERLEALVAEMEGGNLSLKKMMEHFEEGQKLLGFCTKKLDEVERKIEVLVKKGDKVTAEPFADTTDASEEEDEDDADTPGELF